MKFKIAHLCHRQDGSFISIAETSLTDYVLQYEIGDRLFGLLSWVSRGWVYSVRWGPVDEEFGFADKSLGSKLFSLGQWTAGGFGAWKRERTIAELPVSYEWVQEHLPEAGWPFDGSDDEDTEKG